MTYVLKSVKAIEFYDKNPSLDFNNVNEMFIELIQKITNTIQESISVNEIKALLNRINKNVEGLEQNANSNSKLIQMTYDHLGNQQEYYVQQMKHLLQNRDKDSDILSLIRETNHTLIDKTTHSIVQQFPKLTDQMKAIQQTIVDESQVQFKRIAEQEKGNMDAQTLEKTIQTQYQMMTTSMMQTLQNMFSHESLFHQNNMELKQFLEKQKNSTKKGKESEGKLEACLNMAFPYGAVKDKSGESKACDYLLERKDKPPILFENKDYQTNVPNEEIKKFIRDIEYQGKHGVLISQNSGVQNKEDFQIDIHANHIMVFVHYGKYDEGKLRIAVNIIDHLDGVLQSQKNQEGETKISMEQLSTINKEYLHFIGQKKQWIETCKKQHKEQLKQLEDFEMPQLTFLLNSVFTNVDQLSFHCTICGKYNAKNKRALVTHQNKCKKLMMNLNQVQEAAENGAEVVEHGAEVVEHGVDT